MKSDFDFEDRVVIVTGGGQGIGKSICLGFRALGARVVCVEIDSRLQQESLENITFIQGDVSNPNTCAVLVQSVLQRFGRIDILVNNAAVQPKESYLPLHLLDDSLSERMFAVNVQGYRNMAKHVLPAMIAKRSGVIVNISSVHGHQSAREAETYGVTKAANLAQTRQWAVEYARYGIRVNSVSPGAIKTNLVASTLNEQGGERELANRHPLGRLGTPEEVAKAVIFLSSSSASFITGTDLAVDGGLNAFGTFAAPYTLPLSEEEG